MSDKQKARIEETIHQLVAELLVRKIKDPRVCNVSVTRVETSSDYSLARIMYNVVGGGNDLAEVQEGLKSCTGFVRGQIGRRMRLRVIPDIVFTYDVSLDKAMAIEELLQQIHDEHETPDEVDQDE